MSLLRASSSSKKGATYMENVSFTLPNIVDGVHGLGELWDCTHSKSTGFNLFTRKPEADHVTAHPIGRCDYSLVHVKNTSDIVKKVKVEGTLKLELLGGLINVDASASYGNIDEKRSNEEKLVCKYDSETYSVELLPFASEIIDRRVKEMVISKKINATHIVKCIVLGGELSAELSIKESKKEKAEHADGGILGKLAFGSVNSGVKGKLEFLDSDEASGLEKTITVHSKPPMKVQPTTVGEMFQKIESFEESIRERQHFKEIGEKIKEEITGVPIRFILVPIGQFLDVKITKLYIQLKEDILNQFTGMLSALRDYRSGGYVVKRIIQGHGRLANILDDAETPMMAGLGKLKKVSSSITGIPDLVRDSQISLLPTELEDPLEGTKKQGILAYEKELIAFANEQFGIAFKTLNDFKIGKAKVEDLHCLVAKFSSSAFSEAEVDAKIKSFITWGKEELRGIHDIDAVDMKADILRLTNKTALNDWWNTDKSIKILLLTKLGPKERSPNGAFRRIFEISEHLKRVGIEIGLALPSISNNFTLNIRIKGEVMVHSPGDINYVLGIVCSAVGLSCIESYFHTVNASIFKTSLPLPAGEYDDINSLVVNLSMNRAVYITRSPQHTHQKLTSYIEDLERGGKEWKFFICLDAIDTTLESIEKLQDCMSMFSKLPLESEWNAGSFGFKGAEFTASPLLFVFRRGRIEAICFDNLDLLILHRQFVTMVENGKLPTKQQVVDFRNITQEDDLSELAILSPDSSIRSSLYPDRAKFALEVVKLVHQIRNHKLDGVALGMRSFVEPPNGHLVDVLELARNAVKQSNLDVLSTVAGIMLSKFKDLEDLLKRNGWSVASKKFTADNPQAWKQLYTSLDDWLITQNPLLANVAHAKALIKQVQSLPREIQVTQTSQALNNEVEDAVSAILTDVTCPGELKSELERWQGKNPIYRYTRMLDIFEKFILSPEYKEQFIHVLALVSLLKKLVDSQMKTSTNNEENQKKQPVILDVYEILPSYVEKLDPSLHSSVPNTPTGEHSESSLAFSSPLDAVTFKNVNDLLRERRSHHLVTLLAKCSYGQYLAPLHLHLDRLTNLENAAVIDELVESCSKLYNEEQKAELWANPKFQYLVNCALGSEAFLKTVQSCFTEGPGQKLSGYIPSEFAESIRVALLNEKHSKMTIQTTKNPTAGESSESSSDSDYMSQPLSPEMHE